jgi:hypothetical protein
VFAYRRAAHAEVFEETNVLETKAKLARRKKIA